MATRWTLVLMAALVAGRVGAEERSTRVSPAGSEARDGVVTLGSGLRYEVLRAGAGRTPTLADTVVVHYRGHVGGSEFGSTYRSGRPAAFPLRAAIAGWREALQLMPTGSTWRLVVPPHLAYGERGAGPFGPNATLVFEVELVSVVDGGVERSPAPGAGSRIEVSFKLDPRLTRGLYMGDRWVSPGTFTPAPQAKNVTVEASARRVDASGRRVQIEPEWRPGDPGMVEITRGRGDQVRITVKRAGESKVVVAHLGVTKELSIKAAERGEALAVEISQ